MATEGTEWTTPKKPKNRTATAITPSPAAPTAPTAPTATESPTEYSVNRYDALSEPTHTPQATSNQETGNSEKNSPKPTATATATAKDIAPPPNVPETATQPTVSTTGPEDYQPNKLQSYYPSPTIQV